MKQGMTQPNYVHASIPEELCLHILGGLHGASCQHNAVRLVNDLPKVHPWVEQQELEPALHPVQHHHHLTDNRDCCFVFVVVGLGLVWFQGCNLGLIKLVRTLPSLSAFEMPSRKLFTSVKGDILATGLPAALALASLPLIWSVLPRSAAARDRLRALVFCAVALPGGLELGGGWGLTWPAGARYLAANPPSLLHSLAKVENSLVRKRCSVAGFLESCK